MICYFDCSSGISGDMILGLQIESPKIYKAKEFACRSLKGKGVHRVILRKAFRGEL